LKNNLDLAGVRINKILNQFSRGVGYMDVVGKNISYFKTLINLRTYITYNENIASFSVT
jgi:hypothetical protein